MVPEGLGIWGSAQGGGRGTKRPGGGATCLGGATSQQAGCSGCLGRKAVVVTSPATQAQLLGHTEDSELPKEREMKMDKRRSYLPWWSDWSPSRPRRLLPWSEGRVVGRWSPHLPRKRSCSATTPPAASPPLPAVKLPYPEFSSQ